MVEITDEQVEFILNDFEKHGVILEDLRDNLLDHMCCIIENEMTENDNFYRFYESVLPRFFKNNLAEIQTETENLLRFKNFYTMKKILKISGVLTALFTVMGAILKTFHLPGAGITIVLGGFLFSLVFLPLLIAIKLKDEDSKTDKAVFSLGFLLAIAMSAGLIFKLMHWPGATFLMLGGTVLFTFVYVPLYFFTRIRRPELKFNTIVNSVMMVACGGIFFALFDLGNSKTYDELIISQNQMTHENSLQLFESNKQLREDPEKDELSKDLSVVTKSVDDNLEAVVLNIVEPKTAKDFDQGVVKLKEAIATYNTYVAEIGNKELVSIDTAPINEFHRLDNRMCVTILGNIQQQIAVNENTYLVAKLME